MPLTYTHSNGVARISFDNPPQNRLNSELMTLFAEAVQDLAARDDTRVLLLSALGDDFSFGGDITPWREIAKEDFSNNIARGVLLANILQDLPFPKKEKVSLHHVSSLLLNQILETENLFHS